MARRTLITGANGFIGRHLVQMAVDTGRDAGVALILPGTPPIEAPGWEWRALPLSDVAALRAAMIGCDTVVHLAGNMFGHSPARYRAANVETIRHVLTAARGLPAPPRLIYVSSVAAVGPARAGHPLSEEARSQPVCLYGRSKLAGEKVLLADPVSPGGQKGRHLVVRLCSVYGPGDPCFLDLFRWAERGWFPRLATARKRFNLALVTDIARALWRVVDEDRLDGILNVGNPTICTDHDLAAGLGDAAGRAPLRSLFLPPGATRLLGRLYDMVETVTGRPPLMSSGKAREMSFSDWLQDFSRQQTLLPGLTWSPLAQGIALTRRWYSQVGWLP
ncbi:MAG: UDP-glucose 4-epimerase [Candidatus Ozemobacter sibiricus]|uniref:UDP-glucose 4-epimerase n=1 Tax=Candidatus Ozemobacter sibiricus TaxID=2268124 RepID=A0A367ZCZ8_9BACT|nr:MAG: UDP-glucose 4-epimerase [Candidatus Ozemobacter sibiricus]